VTIFNNFNLTDHVEENHKYLSTMQSPIRSSPMRSTPLRLQYTSNRRKPTAVALKNLVSEMFPDKEKRQSQLFEEQFKPKITSNDFELSSLIQEYLAIPHNHSLFDKKGVLFVKKNQIFKKRYVTCSKTDIVIFRSSKPDDDRPLKTVPLNDFTLQKVGLNSITEQKKKKFTKFKSLEKHKAFIFVILFGNEEVVFGTESEAELLDWMEVLQMIEMKNFSLEDCRGNRSAIETIESKINDEFQLMKQQVIEFFCC
jgi:hypothetical protein